MQHDDLIWKNVDQYFCSFKVKTVKATFCRNKYNLTGLCSRMSCPLANSRYATIIEDGDQLLLYIKTVERAHSPRRLWEKIKLSRNYTKALMQIDKYLEHWPEYYIHKAKQRLTKMTQYFLRRRRLALRTKTRLVGVKKKVERREAGREKKAITAAKLETAIEKELLQRLRSGAYGDIYNFPQEQYEKVLEEEEEGEQFEDEEEEIESGDEYEAEYEDSEEEDLVDIEDDDGQANGGSGEYDFDDFSDGDDSSSEGDSDGSPERKDIGKYVRERASKREKSRTPGTMTKGRRGHLLRRRGGVRVEMEYEREQETTRTPELIKQ